MLKKTGSGEQHRCSWKVIDLGWRVYCLVKNSYAPVLPLPVIPCCTLCTSTSDDRIFLCGGLLARERLPQLAH